jgi:hypothetical protein
MVSLFSLESLLFSSAAFWDPGSPLPLAIFFALLYAFFDRNYIASFAFGFASIMATFVGGSIIWNVLHGFSPEIGSQVLGFTLWGLILGSLSAVISILGRRLNRPPVQNVS